MLSDGTPEPRSWPSGTHALAGALKRLAKIWLAPPSAALGSSQVSHGTTAARSSLTWAPLEGSERGGGGRAAHHSAQRECQ
jgi:hypothetical protein